MKKYLTPLLILAMLALPTCVFAQPSGWYFTVTPPHGFTLFVGPWQSDSHCADMLGSAIYSHPWKCHLTGKPADCVITGNGFMYPQSYPYPVPASEPIKYTNCAQMDKKTTTGQQPGNYFLFYSTTAGSVEKCGKYKADLKLTQTIPGDQIGYYNDMKCPGAPCFSIGEDTACN